MMCTMVRDCIFIYTTLVLGPKDVKCLYYNRPIACIGGWTSTPGTYETKVWSPCRTEPNPGCDKDLYFSFPAMQLVRDIDT